MTGVLVITAAVGASTGLFILWNWAADRVAARQGRETEEALRRGR